VPVGGTRHEIHNSVSLFRQEPVKVRRLAAKLVIENPILPTLVESALRNGPKPHTHAQQPRANNFCRPDETTSTRTFRAEWLPNPTGGT
jgi:hypothetical protein